MKFLLLLVLTLVGGVLASTNSSEIENDLADWLRKLTSEGEANVNITTEELLKTINENQDLVTFWCTGRHPTQSCDRFTRERCVAFQLEDLADRRWNVVTNDSNFYLFINIVSTLECRQKSGVNGSSFVIEIKRFEEPSTTTIATTTISIDEPIVGDASQEEDDESLDLAFLYWAIPLAIVICVIYVIGFLIFRYIKDKKGSEPINLIPSTDIGNSEPESEKGESSSQEKEEAKV